MIKTLELFGGIGAPRKSWVNLGIEHKCIDYVEVLPWAVAAYNSMFDNGYKPQDITKWNRNVDVLVHGSPCQDWSKDGLNDINTGRSILYERTLEIIRNELKPRPKVVIWENVTGLISKRHVEHFDHYLNAMEHMGYMNTFKVLNAIDYGMPQNRERVFTVSVLGDEVYNFPEPIKLTKTLKDFIDFDTDPAEYQLSENEKSLFFNENGKLFVKTNNSTGKIEVKDFDAVDVGRPNSTTRRGRLGDQRVKTITTNPKQAVYYNGILRLITPREAWRLMGFSDEDFDNVVNTGITKAMLYHLAGNSIVVPVLEAIFKNVMKDILKI